MRSAQTAMHGWPCIGITYCPGKRTNLLIAQTASGRFKRVWPCDGVMY